MRVAAYVHMHRTMIAQSTGVGKHINNMIPLLARRPGIDLTVVTNRELLQADGTPPPDSGMRGQPLQSIPWRRRWTETAWNIANWPGIERWIGQTDWIYCTTEAYVARKRARLAVTVHCDNWFEPDLPWYNEPAVQSTRKAMWKRYRRFATDTDLVLPVSDFLATRLTALFGVPPERMRTVGNGVEEEYFQPPPVSDDLKKHFGEQPFVVVVGGLTQRKGAECVIAVAGELRQRRSGVLVLVAGSGEPQFDPAYQSHDNIKRLGYVGVDTGLPGLLAASTALLFPSRYDTFGIPAVEAMAAGTPAIVSHWAGLPEVVGNAGIVVDPAQPADIADIIDQLARDPKLRNKHVAAGRERAERFRWNVCVDRVVAAFQEFNQN